MVEQIPLIINGEELKTAESFPIYAPTTGKELWTASSASVEEANKAVEAAAAAGPGWAATTATQRRTLFNEVAAVLEADSANIIETLKIETAADDNWAAFNLQSAIEQLRDCGGRISTAIQGTTAQSNMPGMQAMIVKEPYGVVLSIAPWNAPLILASRAIVYPLAGGNTVVFKSSELSPKTQYLLAKAFSKLPPGVVNFIGHSRAAAPAVTGALIAHPLVRKVNFTGSTPIGRKIGALCGENLKPVVLELGGKAPQIVLEDADLDAAAQAASFGSYAYAGQVCMATEKVIVHKAIAAEFESKYRAAVDAMFGKEQTLVMAPQAEKVASLISSAKSAGAEVVLDSTVADPKNKHQHPNVILKGVKESMDLYQQESFGPVSTIIEVADEDEAIRHANNTEYGLSASIFTKDLARGFRLAKRIESGAVHINGSTLHDEPNLPHGGRKASGYGRFGGMWGIEEFLISKTITYKI